MPPPSRSRYNNSLDDARSDASGPTSGYKQETSTTKGTSAAEKRRITSTLAASNAAAAASSFGSTGTAAGNGHPNGPHDGTEGMSWDNMPSSVLHGYRSAYHIPTSSASNFHASVVLSSGIGKKAPTSRSNRTSKDTLVTAVRKHFNGQGVIETDVIVNFLYTLKNKDKSFRLRFQPKYSPP